MKALPFLLIYIIPAAVIFSIFKAGNCVFLTPFIIFVIIPLLDLFIGVDKSNVPDDEEKLWENKKRFRIIVMLCVPLTIGTILWGAFMVSTRAYTTTEFIGISISMGLMSGAMGINSSHELTHRVNSKFEPFLSRLVLIFTLYVHWGIEHVVGHHRNVATPLDPATAKKNQSLYRFWIQTLLGTLKTVYVFERERLKKRGYRFVFLRNRIVRYLVLEILLIYGFNYFFGFIELLYFLIQSIVAALLLETINYIEHYGLERKLIDAEKQLYEPVNPTHSWNSSYRITNFFLFNLQRHSDHHYKPGKRYQILKHYEESPQLPTGYAGMVLLSFIPPLYFRIMNKLIIEINSKS